MMGDLTLPRQLGVPVRVSLHVMYTCVHVCAPTLACMCRGMYVYFFTVLYENTPSRYQLSSLSGGFFF